MHPDEVVNERVAGGIGIQNVKHERPGQSSRVDGCRDIRQRRAVQALVLTGIGRLNVASNGPVVVAVTNLHGFVGADLECVRCGNVFERYRVHLTISGLDQGIALHLLVPCEAERQMLLPQVGINAR